MNDYEALDTLENRVTCLESKITGKIPLDDINTSKIKPVLNALHEVDTVLISTLSGRDKITALLKKIDILEKILDPAYLEINYNSDAKIETILEAESDLLFYIQSIQRLEELEPALNSENTGKLPQLSDRLNKLSSGLLKSKEECDAQTLEVKRLISEYKESIFQVTKLFAEIESLIIKLEIESKPKKGT